MVTPFSLRQEVITDNLGLGILEIGTTTARFQVEEKKDVLREWLKMEVRCERSAGRASLIMSADMPSTPVLDGEQAARARATCSSVTCLKSMFIRASDE